MAGRTNGLEVGIGVIIPRVPMINLSGCPLAARVAELTDPPVSQEYVTPYIGPVPRQTTGPVRTNPTHSRSLKERLLSTG